MNAGSGSDATRHSAALAILRVGVGTIFVAHGAQKLFVFGLAGVAGAFAELGIPLASVAGPAVALVEFFGGMALVLGVLTRPTSVALAVTMAVAIFAVHLPAGFFLPNGIEFAFAMLIGSAALALSGAGAYSLDAVWSRRKAQVVEGQKAVVQTA